MAFFAKIVRPCFFWIAVMIVAPACAQETLPKEVQAVIDRSHSSRVPYAVFLKMEVVREGQRTIELNAEFQQGPMHRVEVPALRVLANCDTGEEYIFDARQRKFIDAPEVRGGACGIAVGADEVISGRMLASINGPYGRADVIELIGRTFVRRYAVTEDGIIVLNDYEPRRSGVTFALRTLSATVIRGVQDANMFKPESLEQAYAPAPDTSIESPAPSSLRKP